jgi:hypothetical protein
MHRPTRATDTHSQRRAVVFGGLMLIMLMAALDQTIVSTALPTIVGDLGGLNGVSWVVTSYLLASTAVLPVYGKLGDLYGRKRVLQIALVLFLVGSALCGVAQSLTELIAFPGAAGAWRARSDRWRTGIDRGRAGQSRGHDSARAAHGAWRVPGLERRKRLCVQAGGESRRPGWRSAGSVSSQKSRLLTCVPPGGWTR